MRRKPMVVFFAFLLAAASASKAQGLSPAERKLAQAVEARIGEEMSALVGAQWELPGASTRRNRGRRWAFCQDGDLGSSNRPFL